MHRVQTSGVNVEKKLCRRSAFTVGWRNTILDMTSLLRFAPASAFQPSTQRELYHKQRLILSCGLIDASVLSPETFADKCLCWLMEINLDNLVMTLCGIPDVRLLWSQDKRFKVQFSTLQVGQT